jgi:hypothetical protein
MTANMNYQIGMRFVTCTMAGAHICEAPALMKMLLRVIKPL